MYAIHREGNKQHNLKFFGEQQAHERKLKNEKEQKKSYENIQGS